MSEAALTKRPDWQRIQRMALIIGGASLAVCVLGALVGGPPPAAGEGPAFFDRAQFFRSYLLGFLLVMGVSLGSLALLMVHNLTGGYWGWAIRGVLESAASSVWIVALLFLPLLLGLADVYPWARWTAEEIHQSHLLERKHQWLNVPFFLIRAAIYFAVWLGLAFLIRSRPGEARPVEEKAPWRLRAVSAPGILLLGLTVTGASIDWVMSLEPLWYSTIYGLLFSIGLVLAAMTFAVGAVVLLLSPAELSESVSRRQLRDLGSLTLTFVMLWAYMAFSQYLLIWSGDLPEEIPYYLKRTFGGWRFIAILLILMHFVLPFFLLLSRDVKGNAKSLAMVAGILLLMRMVDLFWVTAPAHHPYHGLTLHWMDLLAPAGVAGLWLAGFLFHLRRQPDFPRAVDLESEGGHHG